MISLNVLYFCQFMNNKVDGSINGFNSEPVGSPGLLAGTSDAIYDFIS